MSRSSALALSMSLLLAVACSDDQPPGAGGQDGAVCGPATCLGCCSNGACVTTPNSAACGTGGQQCLACNAGESCMFGACTKGSSCGPSNCATGCCQAGMCVLGSSNAACGKGGKTCTNCASAGETCKSQACSGGTTCGPGKCAGCCKGGMCLTGSTDSVCGKGGNACTNCSTSSKKCDTATGTCKGGSTCGASNCNTGCCKNNQCHPGNSVSICGKSGKACQDCQAFGKKCDGVTGACVGGGPTNCGPTNCGAGCCKNNSCETGNGNGACGKGGAACDDCSATGKTCDSSTRTCKGTTPSCGPTTCAGCCKGGNCFAGNTTSACGKNAAACVDCAPSGKICDTSTGNCKTSGPTSCGPSNCTGCCDGTKCETGYATTACGKGGQACVQCKAWETCLSNGCTMSAFSKFSVTAISATINQTKTWDWLAVGSYRNPDPFLGFKSGSTGCGGYFLNCSKTINNTYTPYWNHSLGSFSGTYIKNGCLTVRDEDSTTSGISCPTGYDIIGQCAVNISNADIAAGKKTLTSCANPSDGKNYVTSVTIGIKHLP